MCGVAPAPAAKLGHPPSPGVWVLVEGLGPVSGGGILGRGPAETQSVAQKEALSSGLTQSLCLPILALWGILEQGPHVSGSEGGAVLNSPPRDAHCLGVHLYLLTQLANLFLF